MNESADDLLVIDPTKPLDNDDEENEKHIEEVKELSTLEERALFVNTLKQNGDKIKGVVNDFLKNLEEQKIQ